MTAIAIEHGLAPAELDVHERVYELREELASRRGLGNAVLTAALHEPKNDPAKAEGYRLYLAGRAHYPRGTEPRLTTPVPPTLEDLEPMDAEVRYLEERAWVHIGKSISLDNGKPAARYLPKKLRLGFRDWHSWRAKRLHARSDKISSNLNALLARLVEAPLQDV